MERVGQGYEYTKGRNNVWVQILKGVDKYYQRITRYDRKYHKTETDDGSNK